MAAFPSLQQIMAPNNGRKSFSGNIIFSDHKIQNACCRTYTHVYLDNSNSDTILDERTCVYHLERSKSVRYESCTPLYELKYEISCR